MRALRQVVKATTTRMMTMLMIPSRDGRKPKSSSRDMVSFYGIKCALDGIGI
jgi:hypothetical protein